MSKFYKIFILITVCSMVTIFYQYYQNTLETSGSTEMAGEKGFLSSLVERISPSDQFIQIAKSYKEPGQELNLEQSINKIAGVGGNITWNSFSSDKFKENPNVKVVEVIISKPGESIKLKTAKFKYLVDKNVKEVKLEQAEFNNKKVDIYVALYLSGLMAVESVLPK